MHLPGFFSLFFFGKSQDGYYLVKFENELQLNVAFLKNNDHFKYHLKSNLYQ